MKKSILYYNKKRKELARSLSKQSTKAEVKLWHEVLSSKKMHGYGFLRQKPVHQFITDFMCKEQKLIIEIDSYTHEWEELWKLDIVRQKKLVDLEFTVLRFTDEEVLQDIRNVERVIEEWVLDHPPAPLQRGSLHGSPEH